MEIKLKPKQLSTIQEIQQRKAQLNKAFQDLNDQESLLLELIFEASEISGKVSNVKLEKDSIIFDLEEAKKPVKKVSKPKK